MFRFYVAENSEAVHFAPMEPEALLIRAREIYLEQFTVFVARQRAGCNLGGAEIKLRLSDESEVFDQLYCADFVNNDDGSSVVELQSEQYLSFDPILGNFGSAELAIECLQWDEVNVHHDALDPVGQIEAWFDKWFDPDDLRHDPSSEFSNVIHSLIAAPGRLTVDFGSAPSEAFWDLLSALENAGARNIRVA